MKKIISIFIAAIVSLSVAIAPLQVQALPANVTRSVAYTQAAKITTYVYTTNTGSKYHKNGCRYLKKSKIKISLNKAKSIRLTPCKVCNPPKK